ncbi:hypothetical protein GCM10007385_23580 [Tateyamaria omphalii]|nr:hypothetical protein GCM10007385_23580 [Tateyamaria omphalii]
MFRAPLFDDVAEVIAKLDQDFDILDPVVGSETGEIYTLLLALDRETAVHFSLRNIGTYQQTVTDMLRCFANDVAVQEAGQDGIVTLHLTGNLKSRRLNADVANFALTQAFAPDWPWTDAFFVEQMLGRFLGVGEVQCFRVTGVDFDQAVYVFPPHEDAGDVLHRFEVEHLEDWERSTELRAENLPELPQPTPENIEELYEELGIGAVRDKDMNLEQIALLTADYLEQRQVKASIWQVGFDWFVRALWVVVILYVIRTVLLLAFGFGSDWPI